MHGRPDAIEESCTQALGRIGTVISDVLQRLSASAVNSWKSNQLHESP
jgi:hypothetical protein